MPNDKNGINAEQHRNTGAIEEDRKRAETVGLILEALRRKVHTMRYQRSTLTFGDEEKVILKRLNTAVLSACAQGFTVGVMSFIFLRYLRRSALNRQRQNFSAPSGRLDGVHNSPFHRQQQEAVPSLSSVGRQGKNARTSYDASTRCEQYTWWGYLGFFVDGALCTSIAMLTSIQFIDMKTILDEFSTIPLLQGHSVISEEICPVVLRELKNLGYGYDMEIGTGTERKKDVESVYFNAFADFGNNCELRRLHARGLKLESGLDLTGESPQTTPSCNALTEKELSSEKEEDWSIEIWAEATTSDQNEHGRA